MADDQKIADKPKAPAKPKPPVGLHERLEDIHSEIVNTDFEEICECICYMNAPIREKVRAAAKRVLELCDEHERLDTSLREGIER